MQPSSNRPAEPRAGGEQAEQADPVDPVHAADPAELNAAGLRALDSGDPAAAADAFSRAAAALGALGRVADQSAALHNSSLATMRLGDLDHAHATAMRAWRSAQEQAAGTSGPDAAMTAEVRVAGIEMTLGVIERRRGNLDDAELHYAAAAEVYRRWARTADLIDVEINRAVLDERQGKLSDAERRLTAAAGAADGAGDRRSAASARTTLGAVLAQRGRFAAADAALDLARQVYVDEQLPRELADVLTNQGLIRLHVADYAAARRYLTHARQLYRAMKMRLDESRVVGALASLDNKTGNLEAAESGYRAVEALYAAEGRHREQASALHNVAVVLSAQGRHREAVEILQGLLDAADGGFAPIDVGAVEHNLGVALAGVESYDDAIVHYQLALDAYRRTGQEREAAEIDVNLGIAAAARGDMATARHHYTSAITVYRQFGLLPQTARAVHDLGLTWPDGSDARRDHVVPAWLSLDMVRFGLEDVAERTHWRQVVSKQAEAAVRACDQSGTYLLAEAIEWSKAAGSITARTAEPLPGLARDGDSAVSDVLADTSVDRPPLTDCGWPVTLDDHLRRSDSMLTPADVRDGGESTFDDATVQLSAVMLP